MSQQERRKALLELVALPLLSGWSRLSPAESIARAEALALQVIPDEPEPERRTGLLGSLWQDLKATLLAEASKLTWRDLDAADMFSNPEVERPEYVGTDEESSVYFARDLLKRYFSISVDVEQLLREGKKRDA